MNRDAPRISRPKTLVEKIWQRHLVVEPPDPDLPSVLYVDLHLLHEVTSPQAFAELDRRGLEVRCPERTVATMDHSTPTVPGVGRSGLRVIDPRGAEQLDRLEENCRRHDIPLFGLGDERQGIVHVMGPELGLTQPGMTIVCGDSHTSTHGAFGALAFGIGTGEVAHVLATQCLLQARPRTLEVHLRGRPGRGATAKDLILAVVGHLDVDGGTGHVIEYTGEAIRGLDMEGRMTVCNMSIEAGARAGLIAPDETTFDYLRHRFGVDTGRWQRSVAGWRELRSDPDATFDRRVEVDVEGLEPMITWGTHPGMVMPISGRVPGPEAFEARSLPSVEKAWRYMDVGPGKELLGRPVDVVFIGSCTNSRLSDLEAAASLLSGRRVAPDVKMLVVPGSSRVRRQAEDRGLHEVFLAAGAEWREAGCSMCLAMNGDRLGSGQLAVSTTNRNFEGRQGAGGRTILASPLTAAATAVRGRVTDPRELL